MKVQNNGSNGAILFSSDPTAFSLHSAESLVALQSSTPTPKLGTTNGAYKRHKIRSGAVRSSRLHIIYTCEGDSSVNRNCVWDHILPGCQWHLGPVNHHNSVEAELEGHTVKP